MISQYNVINFKQNNITKIRTEMLFSTFKIFLNSQMFNLSFKRIGNDFCVT